MTDQETASAAAAAIEAADAAKKAHDDALAALQTQHDLALAKLDELKQQLDASFQRAKTDVSHVAYASSFVRDVQLKGEEIAAWIKRSLAVTAGPT